MATTLERALRDHLARLLAWEDAHVGYDRAVADVPMDLRGVRPEGLPHSAWELVEHLRITQRDILEFCGDRGYTELAWPDDYWPPSPAPPAPEAWDESVRRYREDRQQLQRLAADASIELAATIPHGTGQTYLRELILVADHSAYHVGQLVLVRRALGNWT